MKKYLILIFSICLICCSGILFTACGGHTHSIVEIPELAATCTQNGHIAYFHCSSCNKNFLDKNYKQEISLEDTVILASHTFSQWTEKVPETCTQNGTKERHCLVCNTFEEQEIPATGHSYGNWIQTKAATCGEDGQEYQECSKSSDRITKSSPKTNNHIFGEATESMGVKTYTCTVCSYEKEVLPTLLNAYGNGSPTNPYLIYTPEQFYDLFNAWGTSDNKYIHNKDVLNVKLMRDIVITTMPHMGDISNIFTCVFDGNNKSITSPNINLFPNLSGEVKNLAVYISGNGQGASLTNQLISKIEESGKLTNVTLQGLDGFAGNFVGFAGTNNGIIENCKNYLNANLYEGNCFGIARVNNGTISNTINYGNLTAANNKVNSISGIVYENHGILTNCVNYGKLTHQKGIDATCKVAGIALLICQGSNIDACKNFGTLVCDKAGALFGTINVKTTADLAQRENIIIENCVYLKNKTTNNDISWLFTRYEYQGNSTVDNVITDENISTYFPNIKVPTAVAEIPQ